MQRGVCQNPPRDACFFKRQGSLSGNGNLALLFSLACFFALVKTGLDKRICACQLRKTYAVGIWDLALFHSLSSGTPKGVGVASRRFATLNR